MKAPRIYINKGHYHLDYHQDGKRLRPSTGIAVDHKDWKKSKSVSKLRAAIRRIENKRYADSINMSFRDSASDLELSDLLQLYADTHSAERYTLHDSTLEQFKYAINFLLKYEPRVTTCSLTREAVLQVRLKSKKDLADVTVKSYFGRLRTLYHFAVREGLRIDNPFLGILIRVKTEPPRVIAIEDEYEVFRELYDIDKKAFAQTAFQRLTAFRVSEVCRLKNDQIDLRGKVIKYINSKGVNDLFPITPALEVILGYREKEEYAFYYRTRWSVHRPLAEASGKVLDMPYTTHQLKKAYSQEVDILNLNDRHFKQLIHHSPKNSDTGVVHYAGRNLRLMKEILEEVQRHWIPFFESLKK